MPLVFTDNGKTGSATDGTSANFNATAVAPLRSIQFMVIYTQMANSTEPPNCTPSGHLPTWTECPNSPFYYNTGTTQRRKLQVWQAFASQVGSGAITLTWAATMNGWEAHLITCVGAVTSGTNAADAIVQTVITAPDLGNATSMSLTLAALAKTGNAAFANFGHETNEAHTALNGFALLTDFGHANPANSSCTIALANATNPGVSWTTNGDTRGGWAAEIAVAQSLAGPQTRQTSNLYSR